MERSHGETRRRVYLFIDTYSITNNTKRTILVSSRASHNLTLALPFKVYYTEVNNGPQIDIPFQNFHI
jgi:hypothetical protein